jgi:hypothetical protein
MRSPRHIAILLLLVFVASAARHSFFAHLSLNCAYLHIVRAQATWERIGYPQPTNDLVDNRMLGTAGKT